MNLSRNSKVEKTKVEKVKAKVEKVKVEKTLPIKKVTKRKYLVTFQFIIKKSKVCQSYIIENTKEVKNIILISKDDRFEFYCDGCDYHHGSCELCRIGGIAKQLKFKIVGICLLSELQENEKYLLDKYMSYTKVLDYAFMKNYIEEYFERMEEEPNRNFEIKYF